MEVKTVIASALTLLGRGELVSSLPDYSGLDKEARELIETLVYCYNAVEDELAHKYIPLSTKEKYETPQGKIPYGNFKYRPIKIKRVLKDGKAVKFATYSEYVEVPAADVLELEYEYAPKNKDIYCVSDYGEDVGAHLIALGIASEYCIINGEAEASGQWEKKYRARLDAVQNALPACFHVPPRRWI